MASNDKKQKFEKAMSTAIRILVYRNHTKSELERKLLKKGFDHEIINDVIIDCENMNYLDDKQVAFDYFTELFRKGYGPRYMRMAMRRKGIESDLIDDIIDKNFCDDEQFRSAMAVLKKKRTFERESNEKKRKAKIFRFLYSRGFSRFVIMKTIDKYEY